MTTSRNEFGICVFNKSEVLIAGGCDDNYKATNNCFIFNTNSKTFKDIANVNTKRCGHVLVNVEGVVYSIGGWNDKGEYLNSIEILDPTTKRWKKSNVKLYIERANHQAVAHKHIIYVFGGWCDNGYTDTIERFNVKTGQIELLDEKFRIARSHFAVAKINYNVYIFGGETYDESATCEIFNLETEEIRKVEIVPFSHKCFTACVV